MVFELWHSESEGSYMYLPRDGKYQASIEQNRKIPPDLELVWTYEARSYFEAMTAYHQHMGWEPYSPEEGWEDTAYDE